MATFMPQTLHALHQGVLNELRIREQLALGVINEFKVNNEHMFAKKAQVVKEKEEL